LKYAPRVLVIEGEFSDRILIAKTIRQLISQADITLMANAAEALRGLAAHVIKPNLIILDYKQPTLSAIEFLICKRQMSHLNTIKTIVFTGSDDSEDAKEKCLANGADQVILSKDSDYFCNHALTDILTEWHQHQQLSLVS